MKNDATIYLRLETALKEGLRKIAEVEGRSLSNLLQKMIRDLIKERSDVDEKENQITHRSPDMAGDHERIGDRGGCRL